MRRMEHVESLLRQGKKTKELLELGFPKQTITRVKRRLRRQDAVDRLDTRPKTEPVIPDPHRDSSPAPEEELATLRQTLAPLADSLNQLRYRVKLLESAGEESALMSQILARLDATPALGLRDKFLCSCGASGYVAIHIQCTKCEAETWWGWFPKNSA